MNTIRLIAIALPMTLLIACGGGGGGGTAAAPMNMPGTDDPMTPPTVDLSGLANVNVVANENSPTIQAVERITGATDARIFVSDAYQEGNLNKIDSACSPTTCGLTIPEANSADSPIPFRVHNPYTNLNPYTTLFLLSNRDTDLNYNSNNDDSISMVTDGVELGDVTLARGNATPPLGSPTFAHLEFRTFAGWVDESIFFGTTQIQIGETTPEYRFISHNAGVPSIDSNPTATGSETTSATWEGFAVASIKSDRTFILGDATITIPDLANPDVDLTFDEWRDLDNQAVSGMSPITYGDLTLTSGSFTSSKSTEQVEGRFYGTGHTEVGGWFNTPTVTGAFGGTRQ